MEGKQQEQTKDCAECKEILPLRDFASHIDARTGDRYYRRQCRYCTKIKYQAAHGKPKGILRHLTAADIEKIRANADLFARDDAGRYKHPMTKIYGICKPGVSLGIWYRAASSGDFARIIQEKKE